MRIRPYLLSLSVSIAVSFAAGASAMQATRDIKVISSAGARAMADACTAWAEQNKVIVAMAILDWGGNLIESHAMEGAPANAIDTALLKAKSALRWRRATSETNKMVRSGENLAPTFMNDFPQPGALPVVVNGQVVGAMGVSSGDGEKCAQAAIDKVFKGQAVSSADSGYGRGGPNARRVSLSRTLVAGRPDALQRARLHLTVQQAARDANTPPDVI
jgi:glc operon protein GlcG